MTLDHVFVTSWTRLEPSTRDPDMEAGLACRIADPAWFLTRQWQFGEFLGEDAASAATVKGTVSSAPLDRYRPGPARGTSAAVDYDASQLPLEFVVEAESPNTTLRRSIELGLWFLAELQTRGVSRRTRRSLASNHPTAALEAAALDSLDARSREWHDLVATQSPDGYAIYDSVLAVMGASRQRALPSEWSVPDSEVDAVTDAAGAFLDWVDSEYGRPATDSAWDVSRLEYTFSVGAHLDRDVVLRAEEYPGGHLDWWNFDVSEEASLRDPTVTVSPAATTSFESLATGLVFPGMPVKRLWQFEDSRVSFAETSAKAHELARLVLIEYALAYGNDFYLVPIEAGVGTLTRVSDVIVTDTFGGQTKIEPSAKAQSGDGPWTMFTMTGSTTGELLLAPSLGFTIDGPELEEVRFLRDELANLAWAVEARAEDPTGRSVDRLTEIAERRAGPAPTPSTSAEGADLKLKWTLASAPPEHWYPLVPVHVDPTDDRSVEFRLGSIADLGLGLLPTPVGRLLGELGSTFLREEELPRSGLRLRRAWQYGRWSGGSTLMWIAREKSAGRGEGSSGLRFDQALPD